MLIRSFLTLFVYTTSTIAAAQQPGAPAGETPAATPQEGPRAEGKSPTSSLVPDITPPAARRDWQTEHRFLQAGTGVSWTLVGLGVLGMAIPLGMLSRCNATERLGGEVDCGSERRTAAITAPILGIMTLASLVPAVLFTRRLANHKRERGVARLQFTPGGVALQF